MNPITEHRLSDARETIVAALVQAFELDADEVEDTFMPTIDNEVRKQFGHEAWLGWVA